MLSYPIRDITFTTFRFKQTIFSDLLAAKLVVERCFYSVDSDHKVQSCLCYSSVLSQGSETYSEKKTFKN